MRITLTSARMNAGLTLEEVAKYMKKSTNTINNWEKGRTSPKISEFNKLCNLYKISYNFIDLSPTLQKVEK